MSSRFIPYATTPSRLLAQLISDIVVTAWTTVWVMVGMAVHSAVSTIAEVGRQVRDRRQRGGRQPRFGGRQHRRLAAHRRRAGKPLRAASEAALDIAGAGHSLDTTASWLAWVLALAVAAPPILFVAMPWLVPAAPVLPSQVDRDHPGPHPRGRAAAGVAGAGEPAAGQAGGVHADPVGAWRGYDADAIRGLAALELRSAGVARRL